MSGLEIALFIIFLVISHSIYRAIGKITDSHNNLSGQIKDSLVGLRHSVNNLASTPETEVLDSLLKIPPDMEALSKRKDVLVKCYANYLSQTKDRSVAEALSPDEATIRANFEIDKFGIENILKKIHWEDSFKSADSEKKFLDSDFFRNEIKSLWTSGYDDKRYIDPFELFNPIYIFMKKDSYKIGESVILNKRGDVDYYSYIKNRAILHNLRKLGVIKSSESESNINFFDLPFKFMSDDLEVIKGAIITGCPSVMNTLPEDNTYFDDYLSRHQTEQLFEKWTKETKISIEVWGEKQEGGQKTK